MIILKGSSDSIDKQDGGPGAKTGKNARGKFILAEDLKRERRRPVGKRRFLYIDGLFQPGGNVIAGFIHGTRNQAVTAFIRLHEGHKGEQDYVKDKRNDEQNQNLANCSRHYFSLSLFMMSRALFFTSLLNCQSKLYLGIPEGFLQ